MKTAQAPQAMAADAQDAARLAAPVPFTLGVLETGKVNPKLAPAWGEYAGFFERMVGGAMAGVSFRAYPVIETVFPDSVTACDAWLVTGSRHGVYEALPWMARLQVFLRDAVDAGRPVVGICFGHQILAEAMGGRVVKSEKGWGLGVRDYAVTSAGAETGLAADGLTLHAVHQDQVVETPPGATVLAGSDFCPVAALGYGDLSAPTALSIQPHPEFDTAFTGELITLLEEQGKASDQQVAEGRRRLGETVDGAAIARWIATFLAESHARRVSGD